jgi:putative nucleotidyltransferase with HDIG domain
MTTNTEFLNRLFTLLEEDKLVLPTLPEIALKIRELLKQEHSSLEDLASLINKDAAITARLMQIANSALFRTGAPITTVDNAIKRLGRSTIENIVIGMAMEKLFVASTPLTDRKLKEVWQHSMDVSMLATTYSRKIPHLKSDLAMLAGLVHDIGILPIITLLEEYPDLLQDESKIDELIMSAHVQVGTAIAQKWNFPALITDAVKYHEDLGHVSGAKATYTDLVIVANLLSEYHVGRRSEINVAAIPAFEQLGMQDIDLENLEPTAAQAAA